MAELITQSLKYREEYDAGIKIIIANRQAECDKLRSEKYSPEKISANREKIRKPCPQDRSGKLQRYRIGQVAYELS